METQTQTHDMDDGGLPPEALAAEPGLAEINSEPEAKPVAPPPKKKPAAPRLPGPAPEPTFTSVKRQMDGEDAVAIKDFLEGIAGDATIKVNITRKLPRFGPGGQMINGSLETVEGVIDEEYIREMWGGGEYLLKVYTPQGKSGSFGYFKGKSLKIAGPPKMHGKVLDSATNVQATISADTDPLIGRAFEKMGELAETERGERRQLEREKLELMREGRGAGMDPAIMTLFTQQLESANQRVQSLEQTIRELSNKPAPTDSFRDRMLERAIEGEGKEIAKLRDQYEARIDRLREDHERRITSLEDRHDRDVKMMEQRHEREIAAVTRGTDMGAEALKAASGARYDAAKETISRLERELTAQQGELATLRGQKNQTIGEKADELLKVQEVLDGFSGKSDGDDPKWYEKLAEVAGSAPVLMNLVNKIGGGPPQQQQQQPQLPPPGIPFSTGDGNVYVRDAAGNVKIVDQQQLSHQRKVAQVRAQRKAGKKPAAPAQDVVDAAMEADDDDGDDDDGDDGDVAGRPPSATEMKIAVTFIENALKANAPVEQFAQTARNLVPSEILAYMSAVGFEKFLAGARLEPGSPLATVRGRQFLRNVVKFLQEGSLGEGDEAPAGV